ncbi:hypothetical protein PAECIP112173_02372 [Paenibacillus sp. JJ-100]|nr:hypothetical protein PAECIP112173_02372 [Paenibacillus sp. JJ-100]
MNEDKLKEEIFIVFKELGWEIPKSILDLLYNVHKK